MTGQASEDLTAIPVIGGAVGGKCLRREGNSTGGTKAAGVPASD